jgi:hypothetical protein
LKGPDDGAAAKAVACVERDDALGAGARDADRHGITIAPSNRQRPSTFAGSNTPGNA